MSLQELVFEDSLIIDNLSAQKTEIYRKGTMSKKNEFLIKNLGDIEGVQGGNICKTFCYRQ